MPTAKKPKPTAKTPKKSARAEYGRFASTTQSSGRRILFTGPAQDARKELNTSDRITMMAKSRWAERNSPTYKQVLDEVVLITIGDELIGQSGADNAETAKLHNIYFANFCKSADITKRFTFGQVQKLCLRSCLGDGDVFKVNTFANGRPKVQIIEAHRVGSPRDYYDSSCIDGVFLGKYGEVVGYNVYTDDTVKNRFISSESMTHVVELDRASGVRGLPIMQSSLGSTQDQLEIFGLEVRAVRDSADSTLILKKQGGVLQDDAAQAFAGNGGTCDKIASQMGGKLLVVDTNESFEQLVNMRPSPAWLGMMKAIERDIVKLLPVEYVCDPSGITGPAIRLIAAKVSRCAAKWQNLIIDTVCDNTWDYVIAWGIKNNEIPDDPNFNRKTWITPRDITVDAGREAAQDRADLIAGLTTAQAILGKKGMTHDDVVATRVREMSSIVEAAKASGLPLWMLYQSPNNWLQQGQDASQVSQDVADNLDIPPPPTP